LNKFLVDLNGNPVAEAGRLKMLSKGAVFLDGVHLLLYIRVMKNVLQLPQEVGFLIM
jgi:hypothetical protein